MTTTSPTAAPPPHSPVPIPLPILAVRGYETDPGSGPNPTGGLLITAPIPNPASPAPALHLQAAPAPAGLYLPGTPQFRYWDSAEAACRARNMWHTYAGLAAWNASVGPALPVLLDQGIDLNAFYDRHALNFFHAIVAGRVVFSCESPDIVCHEEGHAVLDSVQPRLFTAGLTECAAFHEAFGDMSAMLSALQLTQLRHDVLVETSGVLYRNSRLSRLAEELGWAIRQLQPTAVDPDCLRNAVNAFVYHDPATLPSSAPASSLSSEAHSFSRVFSSAFLLAVSNVFSTRPVRDEATLLAVATELAQLLIAAVRAAPVVPRYYAAVAGAMVSHSAPADHAAIRAAFVKKLILPTSFPIAGVTQAAAEFGAFQATHTGPVTLAGAQYALDADVEVDGGDVPQGSRTGMRPMGMNGQELEDPSPDFAAHIFLTHLLQNERVVLPNEPEKTRTFSGHVKTHRLVKSSGTYKLERILFDCGLHTPTGEAHDPKEE